MDSMFIRSPLNQMSALWCHFLATHSTCLVLLITAHKPLCHLLSIRILHVWFLVVNNKIIFMIPFRWNPNSLYVNVKCSTCCSPSRPPCWALPPALPSPPLNIPVVRIIIHISLWTLLICTSSHPPNQLHSLPPSLYHPLPMYYITYPSPTFTFLRIHVYVVQCKIISHDGVNLVLWFN